MQEAAWSPCFNISFSFSICAAAGTRGEGRGWLSERGLKGTGCRGAGTATRASIAELGEAKVVDDTISKTSHGGVAELVAAVSRVNVGTTSHVLFVKMALFVKTMSHAFGGRRGAAT